MTQYPVYIIISDKSLQQLREFFQRFGPVDFMRVVFGPGHRETNRTLVLMPGKTYEALRSAGYFERDRNSGRNPTFDHFELRPGNYPNEQYGERDDALFVPVPTVLCDDERAVEAHLQQKLELFAHCEIIPMDSWHFNIPVKSRTEGGVKGGCFISFTEEVSLDEMALVRVLLTDTLWHDGHYSVACRWARTYNKTKEESADSDAASEHSAGWSEVKHKKRPVRGRKVVRGNRPANDSHDKFDKSHDKSNKFSFVRNKMRVKPAAEAVEPAEAAADSTETVELKLEAVAQPVIKSDD